eukprot:TRINITY_DN9923_c0_g1_i1.p1 TRINITY_DN9923_c0_g1~~TRINITY_DN9923_c0_g1_i1.p1  ORF type:complete len:800 (+),score=280.86 TRINITY_DN9923_c0_g1_i1:559-2958(+)
MGKGRDKRKKAANDKEGGRNKANNDKKHRQKNLEKRSRREKFDDEGELKEEDIEMLLEQYSKKEKKKREVIVEECDAPSERINATFTANPMNSAEVILFGGEYWNGERTDSYNTLYRFNTDRLVWKTVSSPVSPSPRSSHQVVTYKNYMLSYGGEFTSPSQSQFYHHKDLWRLNLNTWEWEEIKLKEKGTPQARSGHRMVLWKRTAVMFGGFHDTVTSTAQYFDDTWTLSNLDALPQWKRLDAQGEKPSKRSAVNLCVYGDTMFLYGGYHVEGKARNGSSHSDLFSLNLANNMWTRVKKAGIPPNIRSGMSVTTSARKAIFFGGAMDYEDKDEIKSRFYNDMYVFNMDSKRWFPLILKKKKAQGGKRRKKGGVSSVTPVEAEEVTEPEPSEASGSDTEDSEEAIEGSWASSAMPKLSAAKKKVKKAPPPPKKKKGQNPTKKEEPKPEDETQEVDEDLGIPIYLGNQIVGYEKKEEPVPQLIPVAEDVSDEDEDFEDQPFIARETFQGSRKGYAFKMGAEGLGYYKDVAPKKVVTFDETAKERSKKSYKTNEAGQVTPCGRFSAQLCCMGNYMYLYGGQFEEGNREVTLSDMYRVNLNALETFEPVQEMDLSKQDWYESDEEVGDDEDDDEEGPAHGKADSDEDEEDEEDDEGEGEGEEGKDKVEAGDKAKPKQVKGKKRIRSKRDELRAKLGADEGVPTPEPHQTLKDFFATTTEFWQEEARSNTTVDPTAADAAKAIRKEAFRFSSVRYNECRPVLEQIEYLDDEERREAAWRDKKALEAKENDKRMQKLQKRAANGK